MNNFSLNKTNYIIIAVSVFCIALGFILMHGSTTNIEFNPDVFSFKRITLSTIICMIGFIGVIVGIMWKTKDKK